MFTSLTVSSAIGAPSFPEYAFDDAKEAGWPMFMDIEKIIDINVWHGVPDCNDSDLHAPGVLGIEVTYDLCFGESATFMHGQRSGHKHCIKLQPDEILVGVSGTAAIRRVHGPAIQKLEFVIFNQVTGHFRSTCYEDEYPALGPGPRIGDGATPAVPTGPGPQVIDSNNPTDGAKLPVPIGPGPQVIGPNNPEILPLPEPDAEEFATTFCSLGAIVAFCGTTSGDGYLGTLAVYKCEGGIPSKKEEFPVFKQSAKKSAQATKQSILAGPA